MNEDRTAIGFLARVVAQYNDVYHVIAERGEFTAKVTGKFRYQVKHLNAYPSVEGVKTIGRAQERIFSPTVEEW